MNAVMLQLRDKEDADWLAHAVGCVLAVQLGHPEIAAGAAVAAHQVDPNDERSQRILTQLRLLTGR
jgi:hypothetical protein